MTRSLLIAAAVALLAVGWILSGQIGPRDRATATPAAAAESESVLPQVRVRRQTAEPRTADIILQGRTAASRTVEVSAEVRGVVEAVLVEKGATVSAGDPLVRLKRENREARLREAMALAEQRRLEYDAAARLADEGYRAETALAEARAKLEEAKAAVTAMEIELERTLIRAPFDGVLDARPVEVGDFVDPGSPVATVVDLDPILVVGHLSERDVGKVAPGDRGVARFANGDTLPGVVRYISAVADERTRTFRLELRADNPDRRILQGLSSEIRLPVKETPTHRVSPAILTLADSGELGVKVVNAENTVEFWPVKIIDDGGEGVWVTGLPSPVTLITVGQEYVTAGQRVEPVPEDRGDRS